MAATALNDNHIASTSSSQNEHSDIDDDGASNSHGPADDEELEEIKARVREMEEEAEKLKQMQDDITSQITNNSPSKFKFNFLIS